MAKVKVSTQNCTKEEATKDLEKFGEDKSVLAFHLGDRKIGVEIEKKGDEYKAAEYLVDWLMNGCRVRCLKYLNLLWMKTTKSCKQKFLGVS